MRSRWRHVLALLAFVSMSPAAVADPVADQVVTLEEGSPEQSPHYSRLPGLDAPPPTSSEGTWNLLLPDGPPSTPITGPSPRHLHTAILDTPNDRMIVFGGVDGGQVLGDTWALDLSGPQLSWTQIPTTGAIPPRRDHVSVYDPVRQRMLVFGGSNFNNSFKNDVYALDLAGAPTWSPIGTVGSPPGRFAHAGIYDPVRDRMIIFGGFGGTFRNDVWELTLSGTPTWSQITPAGTPPVGRNAMTAFYDPIGDRMLVFGGFDGNTQSFLNDLWALNLSGTPTWTQLSLPGAPSVRRHYASGFDPSTNRVLIHGGLQFATPPQLNYLNDTYQLDLGSLTWTQLASGATKRNTHRGVYHAGSGRFVFYGGYDSNNQLPNDTWIFQSGAWSPASFSSNADKPTQRRDHSAVLDAGRDQIIVFGGWDGDSKNDVWKLNLSPESWEEVLPLGAPPPARFAHTAVLDPLADRMIVFGGADADLENETESFFNDVWSLSLGATPTWTPIVPAGTPPSVRNAMTAIFDAPRNRVLVFGGFNGPSQTFLDDLWELDLSGTPTWREIEIPGRTPDPRRHYAAIHEPEDDRLVIHGGYDLTFRQDSWWLRLSDDKWFSVNDHRDLPLGRNAHRGVLDEARDRMVIFGGYGGTSATQFYLNDVWTLELDQPMRWTRLLPSGTPPSPRLLHTANFDAERDRMIVIGGLEGSSLYNDVWALDFTGSVPAVRGPETPLAGGTGGGVAEFRIHGATPNPTSDRIHVQFSLPSSAAGEIGVYTVNGRQVARRDLSSWKAGRHDVRFTERLAPGVYFVRIRHADQSRSVKVAVVP